MRRGAVLGALGMTLVGVIAGSTGSVGAEASAPPDVAPAAVLPEVVNGEEAIAALGATLPDVAASAGMTATELKAELREDDELWIDKTGAPMYIDAELGDHPSATEPSVEPVAPFPLADTFTLHSNETASKTIFLDFDGHEVTGTSWNTTYNSGTAFTASAYSMDGDSSFSDAEKEAIQSVWQRMAEDFAPFDIDVTTEAPDAVRLTRADSNDTEYGTRLLITNTSTILSTCGCGGIAYLGVFDNLGATHAQYQPAFVFTRDNQSAKFIAEAGSHEVGHNLGLAHDGTSSVGYYTGHANWAPIMGVGYQHPVSQWSKGEYKGANNKQDDFSVMAGNGATLRTDDYGDTKETATFVSTGFPITKTGVISHPKDYDLVKFNAGAGAATITVTPATNSPNLDVAIELLNSTGKAVAKANPASAQTSADVATGLDASISSTLTAGTYYVKIDGTKNGSGGTGYSDYGSLGAWNLSITAASASGLTNVVPLPKIVVEKTVGVPGPVTMANTGSFDPDGAVASTAWKFGDGTANGSGASVDHTYSTVGSYTIEMTVTDNSGGTATKTMAIKAVPAVTVDTISATKVTASGKQVASSTVKIVDAADAAVEGASVSVNFTYGTKKASKTGKTGADGTVVLNGPTATPGTVITATVTKVTAKGKAYNANLASATSATVTM